MVTQSDSRPLVLAVGPGLEKARQLAQALAPTCRIQPVTDGDELFQGILGGERPDLILLEVTQAASEGFQMCLRLGADPRSRGIPVIFLSGQSDAEVQARGFAAGAVDFITEPFAPALIQARIRTHVQLKNRTQLLESMIGTDPLTGLLNQRGFDQILETEWKRASRGFYPLSALMLDLDQFTAFNDRHGREAGDQCLRRVALTLRGCLHRPQDCLARIRGDVFVALLPVCDGHGAAKVAQELRSGVAGLHIPNPGAGGGSELTVSFGIATAKPSNDGSPHVLIEEAQEALDQAKEGAFRADSGRLESPEPGPQPGNASQGPERRAIVLVVDDTPAELEEMAEALQEEFDVLVAPSGEAALSLMARQEPDLVILDVVMPGLDGFEVCRRMKVNPRWERIPVIFLTVLDREENERNGLEVGAVDFLTKPSRPELARLRVRNHVRQIRSHERERALSRELAEAVRELVDLRALLPICAWCQKIRNDQGFWELLADYLQHHLGTRSTHGICPECRIKLLGDLQEPPALGKGSHDHPAA